MKSKPRIITTATAVETTTKKNLPKYGRQSLHYKVISPPI